MKKDTTSMCSFYITESNDRMLQAFELYTKMLDYVNESDENTELTSDNALNYIMNKFLTKHLSTIAKKHGFESVDEFSSCVCGCNDGKQVYDVIQTYEKGKMCDLHDEILQQTPEK